MTRNPPCVHQFERHTLMYLALKVQYHHSEFTQFKREIPILHVINLFKVNNKYQWRIQDLSLGGAPTPKGAIIFQFTQFPKTA